MLLGMYYVRHCVVYVIYHIVSSSMIMLFRERVYSSAHVVLKSALVLYVVIITLFTP